MCDAYMSTLSCNMWTLSFNMYVPFNVLVLWPLGDCWDGGCVHKGGCAQSGAAAFSRVLTLCDGLGQKLSHLSRLPGCEPLG